MTTRSDVTVDWAESPRVAEVALPSEEFIMQDVVDTLRKEEDSFRGMSEEKLLNAAGKEELGGGVRVGITVSLQNTLISFAGRTTAAQTGTVTTGSGTPIGSIPHYTFEDNSATFITNNVVRGSLIINFTDQSIGEVYRVDSETQLTTKVLLNGTDNDWDVNDAYQIYNIQQVRATGGNLVAIDANGQTLDSAVLPTWGTQVLTTSSASATLQELADIQYSSFNGGISYLENGPYSGTEYPTGTPRQPVNNAYDAYAIAIERGLTTGYILEDMNVPTDLPLSKFTFIGAGKDRTNIDIPDAATLFSCTFIDAHVSGYLDGSCTLRDCEIHDLFYVSGFIESCVLSPGTITLGGGATAHFLDCYSGVPGVNTPIVDLGGIGQSLAMRNYNGGVLLQNKNGPESVSIDLQAGQVRVDLTTVTNGTIVVRGDGKLVDDATGDIIRDGATNGNAVFVNETSNYYYQIMMEYMQKKLLTVAKFIGLK